MNYISDNQGNKTAVVIPISEWIELTKKYIGLENDVLCNEFPQWQKDVVLKSIEAIKQNPDLSLEEEQFWNDIDSTSKFVLPKDLNAKTVEVINIPTVENYTIPEWHKEIIEQRLKDYKENPSDVSDFDAFCNELKKELL